MIIQENLCTRCFKTCFDGGASDKHLIVSKEKHECSYCRKIDHVVIDYFRFGEYRTKDDSKQFDEEVKKQKVNPNYSFWGDSCPYVD